VHITRAHQPYLPEPDNDIVSSRVAIGIHCVPPPVIHIDLSQTTQQILEGGRRGEMGRREGGGGMGSEGRRGGKKGGGEEDGEMTLATSQH